jgi:hypothetical protein
VRTKHPIGIKIGSAYAELDAGFRERGAVIERLRMALKFYADRRNWVGKDHYSTPSQDFPAWTEPCRAAKDEGHLAREALGNETTEKRR